MSLRDRIYLVGPGCLGPAVMNALVNGALGWVGTPKLAALPLWNLPGVAADLAVTAFGVAFGTYLGLALQVKRDTRAGKVGPMTSPAVVATIFGHLPKSTFARSVGLGLAAVPVFAVPVIAALAASGSSEVVSRSFVVLKGTFAALEAAILAPLIVLGVLGEMGPRHVQAQIATDTDTTDATGP
jgi:hypothetical protein